MQVNSLTQPLDFAPLMEPVARRLLGNPNERLSKGSELRFGTNGSVEVNTEGGWFCDYEAGDRSARGGVLDLIERKQHCDRAGALRWLEEQGLKDRTPAGSGSHAKTFYDYRGEDGAILFRVERRGKGMSPPFLQHGPDGRGGFHSAKGCMQGVPRVPYRLPELLAADPAAIVYVCEGEKDTDRLWQSRAPALARPTATSGWRRGSSSSVTRLGPSPLCQRSWRHSQRNATPLDRPKDGRKRLRWRWRFIRTVPAGRRGA